MTIIQSRRGFLRGLSALFIAAPAIVRAGSLMPVSNRALVPSLRFSEETKFLEGMSQTIACTIFYGNPDWHPMEFSGLIPEWNAMELSA